MTVAAEVLPIEGMKHVGWYCLRDEKTVRSEDWHLCGDGAHVPVYVSLKSLEPRDVVVSRADLALVLDADADVEHAEVARHRIRQALARKEKG